jgi:ferritin-like metal-binding protein YciE
MVTRTVYVPEGAFPGGRIVGSMDNLRQLFEHDLKDIYYAEHALIKALDEMQGESTSAEVRQAFASHKMQTEGHVKRLDQVFGELGEKAEAEVCPGIEGLIKEKKEFSKEKPTKQILDVFNLAAGAKAERYEISAYEGLIGMAGKLGLKESTGLLRANLQEEEHALSTVNSLSKTMMMSGAVPAGVR